MPKEPPRLDAIGTPLGAVRGARPRLSQLDGGRAILLVGIVANHLIYASPAFVGSAVPGGWACVDVFFVLSGFFIGGMLLKEIGATGGVKFRPFVVWRHFRLYPAMLLVIISMVVVLYTVDHRTAAELVPPAITNALFVFNMIPYRLTVKM